MTPSFAERSLAALDPAVLQRFAPAPASRSGAVLDLCRQALSAPVGMRPLVDEARAASRIVVVVSDATRDEPREDLLLALREVLPWTRVTLVVAAGTHEADDTVIPAAFRDRPVVVHDGTRIDRMVDLGTTDEGTRVRLLDVVATADLVVVTGRVRPHYFAGWSGGLKGLFPGCALAVDALQNHRLKADPTARLGRAHENRCRADMERAALKVPGRVALLNVLCDVDGRAVDAAAGDPVLAHRSLCARAAALFEVSAPRCPVVVVADRPPVTRTLYQASKLLPPAGAILEPGGTVIVVADCALGTGPLERVNRGIYELGVRSQLPANHRVWLCSELPRDRVRETYAEPVQDLKSAVARALDAHGIARGVLLWRAGECVVRPAPAMPGA